MRKHVIVLPDTLLSSKTSLSHLIGDALLGTSFRQVPLSINFEVEGYGVYHKDIEGGERQVLVHYAGIATDKDVTPAWRAKLWSTLITEFVDPERIPVFLVYHRDFVHFSVGLASECEVRNLTDYEPGQAMICAVAYVCDLLKMKVLKIAPRGLPARHAFTYELTPFEETLYVKLVSEIDETSATGAPQGGGEDGAQGDAENLGKRKATKDARAAGKSRVSG